MARRRSRSRWLTALVGPGLVLLMAGATLAIDRDRGILPMLEVAEQVRGARALVDELAQEREQLIQHVRGLHSNPYEIEAVARVKLGMVRPDEVVVRFEDEGAAAD